MAYRPEWDQNDGRGGFRLSRWTSGVGGWSAVKCIIVTCAVLQLLSAFLERPGGYNPIIRALGLRLDNAWWIFPLFTYAFVHSVGWLFHLVFNMLLLWFLGTTLEQQLGRRRFLTLYFGSALTGAFAHLLVQIPFAESGSLIGASGACLGILFFAAWDNPDRRIIFFIIPMRIRTLAYIFLALDIYPVLLHGVSTPDRAAHFCHLGGALFGYLYCKFRFDPLRAIGDLREVARERQVRREDLREADAERELDRILTKISAEGMPSLTRSERKFLKERGDHLRKGR